MDQILEAEPKAPPINTLIVNASGQLKGLPGDGADAYVDEYLSTSYSGLTTGQKRLALRPVHEDVWDYENWPRAARNTFGRKYSAIPDVLGEKDGKAKRLGLGGPAESKEHHQLKMYVSRHPAQFGAPRGCKKGKVEKRLDTLDEIDVWFMHPGEELAVEVKSTRSNEIDRQRGLFQCVKYRALLAARARLDRSKSEVRARLVSEVPLSGKLRGWARALGIEVQVIKPLT
jgi:hypothetical protein